MASSQIELHNDISAISNGENKKEDLLASNIKNSNNDTSKNHSKYRKIILPTIQGQKG